MNSLPLSYTPTLKSFMFNTERLIGFVYREITREVAHMKVEGPEFVLKKRVASTNNKEGVFLEWGPVGMLKS